MTSIHPTNCTKNNPQSTLTQNFKWECSYYISYTTMCPVLIFSDYIFLAGIANVYAGQPLDTVKVKMQAFPSLYKSGTKCFSDTLRSDGIRGLYAGTQFILITCPSTFSWNGLSRLEYLHWIFDSRGTVLDSHLNNDQHKSISYTTCPVLILSDYIVLALKHWCISCLNHALVWCFRHRWRKCRNGKALDHCYIAMSYSRMIKFKHFSAYYILMMKRRIIYEMFLILQMFCSRLKFVVNMLEFAELRSN